MASGFPGGGADFYTGIAAASGRSVSNINTNNHPSTQTPYRTQLSQMFLDQTSQIAPQRTLNNTLTTPTLIGKRSLADFQANNLPNYYQQQPQFQLPQQPNINPALNSFFLRSVKPRIYQHTSPISTLSPMEFSPTSLSPELPALTQRYGMPLLQQLRPQPINLGSAGQTVSIQSLNNHNQVSSGAPNFMNSLQSNNNNNNRAVGGQETEKKMMNKLQELEKQLLDDNDEEEGDAVSVITNNNNSEWSETIQTLFAASSPNPISPSPTSSSSSSSTSVTTPAPNCSKQTLIEAASAVYDGKFDAANEILVRVSQVSNKRGNSEQRLMDYMTSALKSRINSAEYPPPISDLYTKDHITSIQSLYELSPCFKLGFVAANLAIIDAVLDKANSFTGFHVVDFDIGQGIQYVNLLQALSERLKGKSGIIKITAVADNVGEERERLKGVGAKLSQLADSYGFTLVFNVVSCKLGDLGRESLGCEADEVLAVNFAFNLYKMPDESVSTENPRDELLRRVKSLAPRVVTLVEQEMNTNTAPFMARVNEVHSYYGALFDSIESTVVQKDSTERVKVEEGLGRKLANSVACEGRDRVERCEVFGKWRARMGMAGFELKALSQNIGESMKARLGSGIRANSGFTVKEENGGVCFGWMGKTLTVASAWR